MTDQEHAARSLEILKQIGAAIVLVVGIGGILWWGAYNGGTELEGTKDNFFYATIGDKDNFASSLLDKCQSIIDGEQDGLQCICYKDKLMELDRKTFNQKTDDLFDEKVTSKDIFDFAPSCA